MCALFLTWVLVVLFDEGNDGDGGEEDDGNDAGKDGELDGRMRLKMKKKRVQMTHQNRDED